MIFDRLIIHGSKTCLDREDAAWETDKGITLGKHQHCEVLVPHMMPVILSPDDDDVNFCLFFFTLVLPPQDHVGVLAHGLLDCDCVVVEELTAFPRLKLRPSNRGENTNVMLKTIDFS